VVHLNRTISGYQKGLAGFEIIRKIFHTWDWDSKIDTSLIWDEFSNLWCEMSWATCDSLISREIIYNPMKRISLALAYISKFRHNSSSQNQHLTAPKTLCLK
jgi:hypothetical protein